MPDARAPNRLPAANEFSPGQVELLTVLKFTKENAGNKPALVEALRSHYFANSALGHQNAQKRHGIQRTRADNVLIGMAGYGLFNRQTAGLTALGEALLAEQSDAVRADMFARHILRECHGLEVLQIMQGMAERGERPTKELLHRALERKGFSLPRATTHHTKLVGWLRQAHVVDGNRVDDVRLKELLGLTIETAAAWANLSRPQFAFSATLQKMGRVSGTAPLPTQQVLDQAKREFGAIFKEDQIRAQVIEPLFAAGWLDRPPKGPGRGAKSGLVAPTDKLLALDLELLGSQDFTAIPEEIRSRLNMPVEKLYAQLTTEDRSPQANYEKGLALEVLAIRLANDLGLEPLKFRLRGTRTGGAELDLVAEATHLQFSRWLVQCKNTKRLRIPDIAKELGMATLVRAQVIAMVTTGIIGTNVHGFARELMENTPLQVFMIDGAALEQYRKQGAPALLKVVKTQAQAIQQLKRPQVVQALAQAEDEDA